MATLPDIEKTLTLELPADRAFSYFTDGLPLWWPVANHSVSAFSGETPKQVVLEPHAGGAIYEIAPDDQRHDWGNVSVWQPAQTFATRWHPGQAADTATEWQVDFQPSSGGVTITLKHFGWGESTEMRARQHAGYVPGWDFVFGECFGDYARSAG